jgi:hypothetical protein
VFGGSGVGEGEEVNVERIGHLLVTWIVDI